MGEVLMVFFLFLNSITIEAWVGEQTNLFVRNKNNKLVYERDTFA